MIWISYVACREQYSPLQKNSLIQHPSIGCLLKVPKFCEFPYPFKRQPRKMVKHAQTICREIGDELFEFVWPFCGVGT